MSTRFSVMVLILLGALYGSQADESTAPNVVLIVTDDQGFGDFGFQGNPLVDTPALDELAAASVQWDRFYVSPVCSPTRAALMTGRYHMRTGVVDTFKGRSMMDPEEETLAEVLAAAGYATGIFGKWHLGDNYPMRAMDQGFEESLVHRGGGLAQPSEPIENARRYTDAILFRNGEAVETKGYCTDVYFDAALDFIDASQEAQRPFFVYLPTNAPHGPYHDVPEALYQKYRGRDLSPIMDPSDENQDRLARILAMIENIDQNVARLEERLERRGLKDDTLVVFLVDNGPNTRRFVGPYRGMKSEVFEGGIRSPLLLRWPNGLARGVREGAAAAHIDLFPTILELCGVSRSGAAPLDGLSLAAPLRDPEAAVPERSIIIQAHRGDAPVARHNAAVIQGDWKMVFPTGFGRERPAETSDGELYHLGRDPGERNDRAARDPDVVQRLSKAYDQWFASIQASRDFHSGPPEILLGSPEEVETVLTRQDWRVRLQEGWGGEGQWRIRSVAPKDYEVALLFDQPVAPGELRVEIDGRVLIKANPSNVEPGVWIPFGNVSLPATRSHVSGRATSGGASIEVYQMRWTALNGPSQ